MRLPGTGDGVARLVEESMVKVDMAKLLAVCSTDNQSRTQAGSSTIGNLNALLFFNAASALLPCPREIDLEYIDDRSPLGRRRQPCDPARASACSTRSAARKHSQSCPCRGSSFALRRNACCRQDQPSRLADEVHRSSLAHEAFFPLRALRERNRIQHRRALVTKNGKGAADRTGRFVMAIAAGCVEVGAGAGHQCDRSLHGP